MLKKINQVLLEKRPNIGLFQGSLIACLGVLLAFLTMMSVSFFIQGDYAKRIVPSIVLTPLLMACYSLWLLLSENWLIRIIKFILVVFLLLLLLIGSIA